VRAGFHSAFWLLMAIVLVGFGTSAPGAPLDPDRPDATRPSEVRAPSTATLEAYRSQPAYQYERHVDETESIGARLWRWFRETIIAPFMSERYSGITRLTLMFVVVVVVTLALVRLLRMDRTTVRSRRDPHGRRIEMAEVDIQERDFREETERAEREGDFRLAVRLRFLTVLRELDGRAMIVFSPDKTNRTYLREIRGGLGAELRKLVHLFEATWYGHYALSSDQYDEARDTFRRFHERGMEATV
jgi:hypothetical protein